MAMKLLGRKLLIASIALLTVLFGNCYAMFDGNDQLNQICFNNLTTFLISQTRLHESSVHSELCDERDRPDGLRVQLDAGMVRCAAQGLPRLSPQHDQLLSTQLHPG